VTEFSVLSLTDANRNFLAGLLETEGTLARGFAALT
jgi:hypothetical protein